MDLKRDKKHDIISGTFNGNSIDPTTLALTPFNGSVSGKFDKTTNKFSATIVGATISIIINGTLQSTVNTQLVISGTVTGNIGTAVTINATLSGYVFEDGFIATMNNSDSTSITFSYNNNNGLNVVLSEKKCCECCINPLDYRLQNMVVMTVGVLNSDIPLKTPYQL